MTRLQLVNTSLCLQHLCESNYQKLLRLAPELCAIDDIATARVAGKPPLTLRMLERPPYTLTLEFHQCLGTEQSGVPINDLRVRVYLDARVAEICNPGDLPDTGTGASPEHWPEYLQKKWFWNYFLDRWLSYCLQSGYRFTSARTRHPEDLALS